MLLRDAFLIFEKFFFETLSFRPRKFTAARGLPEFLTRLMACGVGRILYAAGGRSRNLDAVMETWQLPLTRVVVPLGNGRRAA